MNLVLEFNLELRKARVAGQCQGYVGGVELKVCYMVKAESIGDNTSNNWGTHVHCDLLFQPSICEPTLLFHLATTKEVQLGNMARTKKYK